MKTVAHDSYHRCCIYPTRPNGGERPRHRRGDRGSGRKRVGFRALKSKSVKVRLLQKAEFSATDSKLS